MLPLIETGGEIGEKDGDLTDAGDIGLNDGDVTVWADTKLVF